MEHSEHLAEMLTAVATFLLCVVTYYLWKATQQLAKSAAEDGRLRKIQATTDAWMRLRPTLVLPNLTRKSVQDKIKPGGKAALLHIVSLESYAACVNSGVYDLETFNRISGAWFLQHFRWIEPYIKLQRSGNGKNPPYNELVKLDADLRPLRADVDSPSDTSEDDEE
jgi:hypothetical protein